MPDDPLRTYAPNLLRAFDLAGELASKEQEHKQAMTDLFLSVADVLDSLDRLLANGSGGDAEACLATCRRITRQLETALGGAGLVTFGRAGETAEPPRHMIAGVGGPGATTDDDIIVDVLRRGCEWNGRVLRPAQVIVTGDPEPGEPETADPAATSAPEEEEEAP